MTESLTPATLKTLIHEARAQVPRLTATPIDRIADVLARVGKTWVRGSPNWERALQVTAGEVAFSRPMIEHSLAVIPELLSRKNMMARLKADLGDPALLDGFVASRSFGGRERALPLGVLFHVSAGNVFLGAIDSLLMGFLTKNVSVVKLSSRNLTFPTLFADSIRAVDKDGVIADKFHLVHFPGGSTALEDEVKQSVDGIIAWGGEDMILSYKRSLPMTMKFIEYGPKISFQVVFRAAVERLGYEQTGARLAADVALWDQAACASPQNLFFEKGLDVERLMAAIGQGFDAIPLPRGRLSDDEHVEILKEKARATYNTILNGGAELAGKDYYLHYDPTPGLRPSPLNRTLILKNFETIQDLTAQLAPFARHLQSCGYLVPDDLRETLLATLGTAGCMRFTPIGHVMEAPIGAPHDGRMGLLELVRLIPDERDATVVGHVNDAIANVPFYAALTRGRFVRALDELPLITGKDLATSSAEKLAHFLRKDSQGGYVFSSGGTSGAPKFAAYGIAEFDAVAGLLSLGFSAQGIKKGDVVANLFVAGNMWSSFLAVDKALAQIGAHILPIGGATDRDQTLQYLEQFPVTAIVGLPTQLLELARRAKETGKTVKAKTVLYAGEHLSVMARSFLRDVFATERFGSAGYASVDAGPIGYQCASCEGGVHHLFAEQVHLEIIDGEAVVTSLIKREMPVIRLRTGDLFEWVDGACACGATQPLFRLLGRADSQFNVWGSRLFLEDVERSLQDGGADGALFQVVLRQDQTAEEFVHVRVENAGSQVIDAKAFVAHFYGHSKDLRATHAVEWLEGKLTVENLKPGGIARVPRTGKIKLLVDER